MEALGGGGSYERGTPGGPAQTQPWRGCGVSKVDWTTTFGLRLNKYRQLKKWLGGGDNLAAALVAVKVSLANHHDDKVDSDQWVVNKELSLSLSLRKDAGPGLQDNAPLPRTTAGPLGVGLLAGLI